MQRHYLNRTFLGMVIGSVLSSILTIAGTGCSTVRTASNRGSEDISTKSLMPVPSSRGTTGDGAVLFVSTVEGASDADQICRLRLVNKETAKSYFVPIKSSEPNVFLRIDPGVYQTGRLGCGISRVWDVDNVFPEGFKVEAGRASYIGKLVFKFSGAELELVRKASRSESAQVLPVAISSTEAASMDVISGFTGLPVDRGVAGARLGAAPTTPAGPELRDGFDIYAKGIERADSELQPLMSSLKTCAKADGDAAQLGRLEYIALYTGGRFSEMKTRDASGLSDQMRSCVERGMMVFHPETKNEVEIRVRY